MSYHRPYFPPTIKRIVFDNERSPSPPLSSDFYRRKIFERSDVPNVESDSGTVLNRAREEPRIVGDGKLSPES
jgi:hypothetical protein